MALNPEAIMSTFRTQARINEQGDLLIHLGAAEAGRQVHVVVESITPDDASASLTPDAYQRRIERLAGAWRGDFDAPAELAFEARTKLE